MHIKNINISAIYIYNIYDNTKSKCKIAYYYRRLGTELVTAFMEYNSYIHIEVQK